jgi:protein MPE1
MTCICIHSRATVRNESMEPNANEESEVRTEYKDDTQVIPRSTSVIAKRMPAARPGRGSSTKYITADAGAMEANSSVGGPGSMGPPSWQRTAMSRRFDGKEETPVVASKPAVCSDVYLC